MRGKTVGMVLAACGVVWGCGPSGGVTPTPRAAREAAPTPVPAGVGGGGAAGGTGAPADSIYFGRREIPARTPGAMRVATYNLLNLFDDVDDPAYSGDEEDLDDAKPAAEKEALASVIRRLDADVLALQEIESESALAEFRDEYLEGMGYEFLVSVDTGDPRGIECAVLSRFPVVHVEHWAGMELGGVHPATWGSEPNDWAGQPITFKRSPLRVDVAAPVEGGGEYVLTMFVVHNKSGGPGGYWREAESNKVVELLGEVRAQNPDANIVVLGDFNARDDDQSVRTLLGAGLTEVEAWDGERSDETTSHESGRRIDHILLGEGAMREMVAGSGFVMGTPSRAPGADWRTTSPPAGYASDHFPVAVELWIGER